MNKNKQILIATIIGISLFVISIAISFSLANQQAKAEAEEYLDQLSSDILRRSAGSLSQTATAIKGLKEDQAHPPCSTLQMDGMNALAAKASYLQGLGYIKNNTLICSTLTPRDTTVALGAENRINSDGSRAWNAIELPNIPEAKFNITESDGYAAFVSPSLVIDILPDSSPITLAQIGNSGHDLVRSRGVFKDEWLQHYHGQATSFSEGDYFVAIRPAGNGDTAAVAAMPEADLLQRENDYAWKLVPVGALVGLILACGVILITKHRLSFKYALRSALNKKEFFLVYQPVIDLRTGRCSGAEALIRWHQSDGQAISPVIFIPAAEEHGLIQQVTAQVMEMVARDAVELIKNNPDTHIAINFSAEDLHSPQTEERLRTLLKDAGASASNILIEATERGLMAPEKAKGILVSIRALGFRVAIDDFGTGNSSLSYLATYDLDFLKIDKMFVDALGTSAPTTKLAFHIINIARSLGLQMIAEGVETETQRDILRDSGVQYAQGWLFGKPMPMNELMEFMRTRNEPTPA